MSVIIINYVIRKSRKCNLSLCLRQRDLLNHKIQHGKFYCRLCSDEWSKMILEELSSFAVVIFQKIYEMPGLHEIASKHIDPTYEISYKNSY